jgi:hypothetical protein
MWNVLEWLAWIVSAIIFVWMVYDGWRVGKDYDEATLLSSREGLDELVPEKKGN